MYKTFLLIVLTFITLSGCKIDTTEPKIVSTFPENKAQNVDPKLNEIWVQFDETMADQSWSWSYENKDLFPELSGGPYYSEDLTKNILPVKLEPNKEYVIWMNTENLKNFKDKAGNPSPPYKLEFKTGE